MKFSPDWLRQEAWIFPESVLDRFAPASSSGGAWGEDGRLYVLGHDRPEMYVLKLPEMGVELDHVATIHVDTEGQAFDFDPTDPRVVWSISRANREVVVTRLPEVTVGE